MKTSKQLSALIKVVYFCIVLVKVTRAQKIFQIRPLLKVYGNLKIKMQNIIFPNVMFTNIILLFQEALSVQKNEVQDEIQEDEIVTESTYIIDVVTFYA